MRRTAALAAGLSLLAGSASAEGWIKQLPLSPEVDAALAKVRDGDRSHLTRLAEAGRPDAQAYLGVLLAFDPNASGADRQKGCGYIEAASAKRADAMHFLGEAYQYGKCGPRDLAKAAGAFHKAGDMGLPKSRCAEGNVIVEMGGDLARAVRLCREGAEAGDADAQTDLGNFYLMGKVVPKDAVEARRWYEKAAAQDQANAAFTLGQIYWNGDGVKKDNAAAGRYWRIAYDHGRDDAAALLGDEALVRANLDSDRLDMDALREALAWYRQAETSSDPATRERAAKGKAVIEPLLDALNRKGRR